MFDTQFSVFVELDDFKGISDVLLKGKKSDVIMDIDVLEIPSHLEYEKEGDIERITFYSRGMDGEYENPGFSMEIQSKDDFENLPDAIYDTVTSFYAFANNINIALTEEGTIDKIEDDYNFQVMGGFFVTYPKPEHIKAQPVYDKDRPSMMCLNEENQLVQHRPYVDELYPVDADFDFEDDFEEELLIEEKIDRVFDGELDNECDEMFDAFIGISSSPHYIQAMHLAEKLMEEEDDAGYFMAAILHCKGLGVKRNLGKALEILQEVENNDPLLEELYQLVLHINASISESKKSPEGLDDYNDSLICLESFLSQYLQVFDGKEIKKNAKKMIKNNDMKGYYYLGSCLIEEDHVKEAIKAFQQGIACHEPYSMMGLACLYLKDGKVKDAVTLFQKAADNELPEAHMFLGQLYLSQSNIKKAKTHLKKFLKYEDDPEIRALLKELG